MWMHLLVEALSDCGKVSLSDERPDLVLRLQLSRCLQHHLQRLLVFRSTQYELHFCLSSSQNVITQTRQVKFYVWGAYR